jgi:hypothetical protein
MSESLKNYVAQFKGRDWLNLDIANPDSVANWETVAAAYWGAYWDRVTADTKRLAYSK